MPCDSARASWPSDGDGESERDRRVENGHRGSSFRYLRRWCRCSQGDPMHYVDGFVAAVPTANRVTYLRHAQAAAAVFKEHGALGVVECWGDDVPDGKLTSFPLAVQRKP